MNIQPNGYYVDIGRGVARYSDMPVAKLQASQDPDNLAAHATTRLSKMPTARFGVNATAAKPDAAASWP